MSEEACVKSEKVSAIVKSRKHLIEERLKKHLVGQESAISLVAKTIRQKQKGWLNERHPLVFLFLGSSGIGKTELAKQVAKYLHGDDEEAFIRLDMSEYQGRDSITRFIGTNPGYRDHDQGGQLTEALKSCNNAVVLLDEVEKAHRELLTILLQLFDEGRLTDGKGQTIECKDAIFIMTSNLASEAISEHAMKLRVQKKKLKKQQLAGSKHDKDLNDALSLSTKFKDKIVKPILKLHFRRDEFLGRINQVVYFLPFSENEIKQLVKKELEFWAAKAKEKFNIEMTWDEKVIDVISSENWNVEYGARSIKQEIENRIISEITEHDQIEDAKKVHISIRNNRDNDGNSLINIQIS